MNQRSKRIWMIIIIILLGLIIIASLFAAVYYWKHHLYNVIMAVAGVVASIIGVIVTLVQVSAAISKTEAVQAEVNKHSREIRSFHSMVSFKAESEKVQNIIDSLTSKEYRYIRWRIAELKDFLLRQKKNPDVSSNEKWQESIDNIIIDLSVDARNLMNKMNDRNYMLDVEAITQHLDVVADLLAEVGGQLENEKYGKTDNT